MLSCIYNSHLFNSDDDSFSEVEKRIMGKDGKFICPVCGHNLYYNSKGKRVSHFSHYPGTACEEFMLKSYDINNELHDTAKTIFSAWVTSQFPYIKPVKDKYFSQIRQICDVYFEINEIKIAFEIQFKHITPEVILERRQNYSKIGVNDIWFFVKDGLIVPGSPYERHYYHSNNRELYYINLSTRTFTYFKGLKKESFNKACNSMKYFISGNCHLDDLEISNIDGSMVIPGWRENYANRLTELRDEIHKNIRKRRNFRMEVLQKLESRMEYRNKHPEESKPDAVKEVQQKLQAHKKSIQKKQSQTKTVNELKYETLSFFQENKKNFLDIKFKNSDDISRFEVLSQNTIEGIMLITCKSTKASSFATQGKGYVIKVFEDREVLTMEEWF